jgi:transposase
MFSPTGQVVLDHMPFEGVYGLRVESLRDLLEIFDREIAMVEREIHRFLKDDRGYKAIQVLSGIGPITAAIFVAEIGDVTRFPTARHLCSWAGMTPKLHESDTKSRRGRITKQGSTIVRWAAVEAVVRYHGGDVIAPAYRRIAERRGNSIARVAAARRLLTLVFYGLRDGEIRCVARKEAA